jgi:hypothetical protein
VFPAQIWGNTPSTPVQPNTSRNQQRAAAHRNRQKQQSQADFKKGLRDFLPSLTPKLEDLLKQSSRTTDDDESKEIEDAIHVTAQQIHEARCEEEAVVHKLLEEWCAGAVGYVPSEKPENSIRNLGENVNSMRWFEPKYSKHKQAEKLLSRYDVDMWHAIETQVNFDSDQCDNPMASSWTGLVLERIVRRYVPTICTTTTDAAQEVTLR